jgi:hypothetical protein
MDFDPGECFDDDAYEEGYEQAEKDFEHSEEEVELDSMGNPVYLAAAAAFGFHMAQDEIDERQIAEDILKNKAKKVGEPAKIPLATRHTTKGHMTPFGRWATKSNINHDKNKDDIEYTKEERLKIMDSEGDWDG